MPIRITLHKVFELSDIWCDEKTFKEVFENDREMFLEFLNEDWLELIQEAGGIARLLEKFEWVDKRG